MENEDDIVGVGNEKEPDCEWCDGTGEVNYDEYSKEGQLIGPGTLTKKCICRLNDDGSVEPDNEATESPRTHANLLDDTTLT